VQKVARLLARDRGKSSLTGEKLSPESEKMFGDFADIVCRFLFSFLHRC
jgi:hypothetical protein